MRPDAWQACGRKTALSWPASALTMTAPVGRWKGRDHEPRAVGREDVVLGDGPAAFVVPVATRVRRAGSLSTIRKPTSNSCPGDASACAAAGATSRTGPAMFVATSDRVPALLPSRADRRDALVRAGWWPSAAPTSGVGVRDGEWAAALGGPASSSGGLSARTRARPCRLTVSSRAQTVPHRNVTVLVIGRTATREVDSDARHPAIWAHGPCRLQERPPAQPWIDAAGIVIAASPARFHRPAGRCLGRGCAPLRGAHTVASHARSASDRGNRSHDPDAG